MSNPQIVYLDSEGAKFNSSFAGLKYKARWTDGRTTTSAELNGESTKTQIAKITKDNYLNLLSMNQKEYNKEAEKLSSEAKEYFPVSDDYIVNGDLTETLYFVSKYNDNYYLLQLLSLNDNIVKIKYQY